MTAESALIESRSIDVEQLLEAKRLLDEKTIPRHVVMYSNHEVPNWFRDLFFGQDR